MACFNSSTWNLIALIYESLYFSQIHRFLHTLAAAALCLSPIVVSRCERYHFYYFFSSLFRELVSRLLINFIGRRTEVEYDANSERRQGSSVCGSRENLQ